MTTTNKDEEVPNLTQQTVYVPESSDSYTILNAIGKGGYADVYKGQKNDGTCYAVKAIPKMRLTSASKQNKVKMEIQIHKSLTHDHIVKFFSNFENDTFIFIVLEYCQHRSMNILIKQRSTLTDPEVRYFLVQVMDALAYLHNKRIIHRDLKAGNILLRGSGKLTVKLCDFGLSAVMTHDNERRKTICGTPNYIAPEILQNAGHSYEADVWSLGCILFALITGKPPFQTKPIKEIYSRVVQAKYKVNGVQDRNARDLIKATLVTDPERRPKLSAFRNHEYFNDWYPEEIDLEVYNECPAVVREYLRNQQQENRDPAAESRTSRSTAPTGHLKNYTLNRGKGMDAGAGAGAGAGNGLILRKQSSMEYMTVVTNLTDSPGGPDAEQVHLKYDDMNDDGVKLTELIDSCLSKFKPTNSLRHISKMDIPLIWAIKWVDYSDTNQGFGYQLSDGSYGVLFRNETKMVLLGNGETVYFLTRNSPEKGSSGFLEELRYSRGRLEVFVNYMNNNLVGFNIENIRTRFPSRTVNDQPFPITWTRGWDEYNEQDREYLIIIVIRPAIYQINFEDHSKIIIDYNKGKPVIMYHKDGAIAMLTELETLSQMGYTEDLRKKLKIANENFRRITSPPSI